MVVPVLESAEPLGRIVDTYAPGLADAAESVEFLFVVPEARSHLAEKLERPGSGSLSVRVLRVGNSVGEAALVKLGAEEAAHDPILVLPPYRKIAGEGPAAVLARLDQGADLVLAARERERDSWINRIQNRAFRLLLRLLPGIATTDIECGVWAARREVLLAVPHFSAYYRFMPLLAKNEGFDVVEQEVAQHHGDATPQFYPFRTYVRRLLDVFGLFFLIHFTYKPLRFFGLVGGLLSAAGGALLLLLLIQRLAGQALADRPALVLAVLVFTVGIQFVAIGLVGEIVVHFNVGRRSLYRTADPPDAD